MVLRAVLFDAYGTLLNVHPVASLAEQLFPGQGQALTRLWREKQTEYTRMIAASERAGSLARGHSFWELTAAALRLSAARLSLSLTAAQEQALIQQQRELAAFAGAAHVLQQFRGQALICGTLSQDNPDMLAVALKAAGLAEWLGPLISMHGKQRYRNDPQAWALGVDALEMPARDILFVSADYSVASAASWFGYSGLWLQHGRDPPDSMAIPPSHRCETLLDVLTLLEPAGVSAPIEASSETAASEAATGPAAVLPPVSGQPDSA